jgi:hypothetical protein
MRITIIKATDFHRVDGMAKGGPGPITTVE